MDAKEFLMERQRMCNFYRACVRCPAGEINCSMNSDDTNELVDMVEKWSNEHKIKTNLDKLREIFPKCSINWATSPSIGKMVYLTASEPGFWNEEYKEVTKNE